ncbi:MAG TPA: hypothetical protein VGW35_15885 [Methylomirabilota bacterium]|nr:hypothetical protein [Methylomirabilota bacterium]
MADSESRLVSHLPAVIEPANHHFQRVGWPVSFPDALGSGLQDCHDEVDHRLGQADASRRKSYVREYFGTAFVFFEAEPLDIWIDPLQFGIDQVVRMWRMLAVKAASANTNLDRNGHLASLRTSGCSERRHSRTELIAPCRHVVLFYPANVSAQRPEGEHREL